MLSSTAKAGSKALKLQKAVKWKRGHQVVIAPTDYRWQEAEVGTIAKVKDKGKRIILKEPLTHSHFAGKYKGVKMYGEVGLLTRHIKIQGNNAVDDPDGFGCHTMIRKGTLSSLDTPFPSPLSLSFFPFFLPFPSPLSSSLSFSPFFFPFLLPFPSF